MPANAAPVQGHRRIGGLSAASPGAGGLRQGLRPALPAGRRQRDGRHGRV